MVPELDGISTALSFVAVMAVGIAGLFLLPIGMESSTILLMVLPSMVVFGAIMLIIGMAYGKYRATT